VGREVRRLLAEVGAGGGYIAAPTHSLGRDIPPENLIALAEELAQQGRA
jgi:uroporphyrinogen-III decarboxylase